MPPCFDIPTIEDRLDEGGVPWSYYAATSTQPGYIWSAFSSIEPVFKGPAWGEHVFPVDQVTRDVGAGSLAPVTFITPRFQLSGHPGCELLLRRELGDEGDRHDHARAPIGTPRRSS